MSKPLSTTVLTVGASLVVYSTAVSFAPKVVSDVLDPDIPFVHIEGKPVNVGFVVGVVGIVVLAAGLLFKVIGK